MSDRTVALPAVLALALVTAGCAAGAGRDVPSYAEEIDQLAAECRAREGILTPIPGAATGQPRRDYACSISGGASRIN
jgi:predicted small secreted protein